MQGSSSPPAAAGASLPTPQQSLGPSSFTQIARSWGILAVGGVAVGGWLASRAKSIPRFYGADAARRVRRAVTGAALPPASVLPKVLASKRVHLA